MGLTAKHCIVGLALLSAGFWFGDRRSLRTQTATTKDSLHFTSAAPDDEKSRSCSSVTAVIGGASRSSKDFLRSLPLSELKEAYDERFEALQKAVYAEFPMPSTEQAMKKQAEEAFAELDPHFTDKSYWVAKVDLPGKKGKIALNLLFSVNHPPDQLGSPNAISATGPVLNSAPQFSQYPVPMPANQGFKNLCWFLEITISDSKPEEYSGGSSGGCLEHLGTRDGIYYSSMALIGKELEKSFSHVSLSIPQPAASRGKLFTMTADRQTWDKDPVSVDWNPISEAEAKEIQAASAPAAAPSSSL